MSRHEKNTSKVTPRRELLWRIDWVFRQPGISYTMEACVVACCCVLLLLRIVIKSYLHRSARLTRPDPACSCANFFCFFSVQRSGKGVIIIAVGQLFGETARQRIAATSVISRVLAAQGNDTMGQREAHAYEYSFSFSVAEYWQRRDETCVLMQDLRRPGHEQRWV